MEKEGVGGIIDPGCLQLSRSLSSPLGFTTPCSSPRGDSALPYGGTCCSLVLLAMEAPRTSARDSLGNTTKITKENIPSKGSVSEPRITHVWAHRGSTDKVSQAASFLQGYTDLGDPAGKFSLGVALVTSHLPSAFVWPPSLSLPLLQPHQQPVETETAGGTSLGREWGFLVLKKDINPEDKLRLLF